MLQPMLSEFAFDFPQQGSGPYRVLRGVSDRLVREAGRSMQEPELATKHRLQVILEQVRGTSFGRDNGLENVKSLEDFRSALGF